MENFSGGFYTFSGIRYPQTSAGAATGSASGRNWYCGGRRRGGIVCVRGDASSAALWRSKVVATAQLRVASRIATPLARRHPQLASQDSALSMGFSDRILGRKSVNGGPHIEAVAPALALAGGEVRITGTGLRPQELRRPKVQFGDVEGSVVVSSEAFLVARVPEGATSGPVVVASDGRLSNAHTVRVAVPIAENLHPVTNPALDAEGSIYATFSGSRGEKVPVSVFKIDTNYAMKPFVAEMMNATSIAFVRPGTID